MFHHIPIPDEFVILCVNICQDWATNEVLRTVASTGKLTTRSRRPREYKTDAQWQLALWKELAGEAGLLSEITRDNKRAYRAFEKFCDDTVARLEQELQAR